MEKVLEQALPEVTKTIEPELAPPPPETTGGFPWGGTGIVLVVVAAAVLAKFARDCKK